MRRPLSEENRSPRRSPRDRFAANVKQLRERQKLTQTQLAEAGGISRDEVSKVENRRREPKVETIVRLANGLDVPLELLFEGIEL